jgi:hypothetical protein
MTRTARNPYWPTIYGAFINVLKLFPNFQPSLLRQCRARRSLVVARWSRPVTLSLQRPMPSLDIQLTPLGYHHR